MSHRRRLAVSVAAIVMLTSCGGAPGSNSDADLVVIADDIDYDANAYTVAAGDIEIELVQQGAIEHSLLIEDIDGNDVGIRLAVTNRGDTDITTIGLTPDTYIIYCDIPGHRRDGMVATLTVTEPVE